MQIERAAAGDYPAIVELLNEHHLPQDGLDAHMDAALVLREGDAIRGSAALELYGDAALLRSVAVSDALRGQGWGRRITESALALARQNGVQQVYLLTETAPEFFAHLGFSTTTRDAVTPAVKQSVEFTTACPQSAQVMVRKL